MLIQILVVGGGLYVGTKVYPRLKKPPKLLIKQLNVKEASKTSQDSEKPASVWKRATSLLRDSRDQQFDLISNEKREISEAEKAANKDLITALVSSGFIAAGTFFYPPLWFAGAGIVLYLTAKISTHAFRTLVQERRVTASLFDFLLGIGFVTGGYFGVTALAIALLALNRKLVARTEDTAHKKLVSVFNTQTLSVWVVVDGVEIEVPFEQIGIGDMVVVSAGQRIPVDGIIVEGTAAIDQHMLTGESQLAEKSIGDHVLAATTLITGQIHIQVEQAGDETIAAQIGEILNNTMDFRQQIALKSETIANAAVLPTLGLSALAMPVGGLNSALAILFSYAGYNLRFTGPISMLNFLQIASHESILIKDGRSLELLSEIDTVIFDKTGTLTLDELRVNQIFSFCDLTSEEILTYAATAEYRQTHPIAKAILAEAQTQGLALPEVEEIHYEVGYGIRVIVSEQVVQVGSDRFMALEQIEIDVEVRDLQTISQRRGHSLVFVAVDRQLVGAIELQPTVRAEAKAVIDDLRKRNLSLVIISGDQEEPTKNLAQQLGIEQYFANTLPKDKAKLVEQLQQEGKSVCFIGDGINDSIALKKANVSISLRGATTVATDVAQIVLMDGSLAKLPFLLELSDQFAANMNTNVILSIVPAVICGVGVFFFHWGLISSFIIYDLGVVAGLLNSSVPLLKDHHK